MSACPEMEIDMEAPVGREGEEWANTVDKVRELEVDLHALTSGRIDWDKVEGSIGWMATKIKECRATEEMADKEGVKALAPQMSQYLAKTCVLHMIQMFHSCRFDKAKGFAKAQDPAEAKPEPPTEQEEGNPPASEPVEGSSLSRQPSVTV